MCIYAGGGAIDPMLRVVITNPFRSRRPTCRPRKLSPLASSTRSTISDFLLFSLHIRTLFFFMKKLENCYNSPKSGGKNVDNFFLLHFYTHFMWKWLFDISPKGIVTTFFLQFCSFAVSKFNEIIIIRYIIWLIIDKLWSVCVVFILFIYPTKINLK